MADTRGEARTSVADTSRPLPPRGALPGRRVALLGSHTEDEPCDPGVRVHGSFVGDVESMAGAGNEGLAPSVESTAAFGLVDEPGLASACGD
jgi:hypothetical protein